MARYTAAYSAFINQLDEVSVLRKAAKLKEKTNPILFRKEINALCRGSIVLLSSHVEAYIKDLGETALDAMQQKAVERSIISSQIFYHISKHFIDEIRDTSDHAKIADKVFSFIQTDGAFWSRTGPFLSQIPSDRFNKGFSNPAFSKIKTYFNRFGYDTYRTDFYRALRADAAVAENTLDHLVDTRNNIAHGDPAANKNSR